RARIRPLDPTAGQPGAVASGVGAVRLDWGDRAASRARRGARHVYRRAGLYRLRVTVTDRAGNTTAIARYVRILP
ncbi:MAG: PKD domain-containing protein, partial [Catenulispora sp.]